MSRRRPDTSCFGCGSRSRSKRIFYGDPRTSSTYGAGHKTPYFLCNRCVPEYVIHEDGEDIALWRRDDIEDPPVFYTYSTKYKTWCVLDPPEGMRAAAALCE